MARLDDALSNLQNVYNDNKGLRYFLMNKDVVVSEFILTGEGTGEICEEERRNRDVKLPFYMNNLQGWLESRSCAKHRKHIDDILTKLGGQSLSGFIRLTHCLSMNDTLWVKSEAEELNWNNVSLYRNRFDDVISRLAFEGYGIKGERMSTTMPEATTDGAYDKCWLNRGDKIILVKAGTTGASNAGLEPYCEVLASQVFERLCRNSVKYTQGKFAGRVVSECEIFTTEQYGYKPYVMYNPFRRPTLDVVIREYDKYGDSDNFARMIVADSVCVNTDRHFGNFGYLVDNDTFKIKGLNPTFDYNMAFAPYSVLAEDYGDFDHYLSERLPVFGRDHYSEAQKLLTPSSRAELINLKNLDLKVECDEKFTEKRLEYMNIIKDTQINRILGNVKMYSFPT